MEQIDYNEPIDDAGHVVGDGLKAELAEARAQIAAIEATDRRLIEENGRLEAQIAAKDAALAELKGQWERLLEAYSAAKARSEQ